MTNKSVEPFLIHMFSENSRVLYTVLVTAFSGFTVIPPLTVTPHSYFQEILNC